MRDEKGSTTHKIIDLESTGFRISARFDNDSKQKYCVFVKLSLAVIEECEVAKNYQIFLIRAKYYYQEINRHLDGNLNNFGPMVFAGNQEQK